MSPAKPSSRATSPRGRAPRFLKPAIAVLALALVAADHDGVDYAALVAAAPLVVDTRGVCARLGLSGPNVVTA